MAHLIARFMLPINFSFTHLREKIGILLQFIICIIEPSQSIEEVKLFVYAEIDLCNYCLKTKKSFVWLENPVEIDLKIKLIKNYLRF